jgi:nucleoside 2-deoxyribosyltransferase
MKPTVYLAGPIGGLTPEKAKGWRTNVIWGLRDHGIQGISPLRCEPPNQGSIYATLGQPDDPLFGSATAIGAKNEFDARMCDMLLAYLPTPSVGTLIELGWGKALNKPVILVSEDPDLRAHPDVIQCSSWILTHLDEAVEVIIGVLSDYA